MTEHRDFEEEAVKIVAEAYGVDPGWLIRDKKTNFAIRECFLRLKREAEIVEMEEMLRRIVSSDSTHEAEEFLARRAK